jgi:hypothetical protein
MPSPNDRLTALARSLVLAEAKARYVLSEADRQKLASLLPLRLSWALAVALASWYLKKGNGAVPAGSAPATKLYPFFDSNAALLSMAIKGADEATSDLDLARAGGYFASAVKSIDLTALQILFNTPLFQKTADDLLRAFPQPADLADPWAVASTTTAAGTQPKRSRARQFDSFQLGASKSQTPSQAQIAQWRQQLQSGDLNAETRWLREQQLMAANQKLYDTAAQAQAAWQKALSDPNLNPNLREYFTSNLTALNARQVMA